MIYKTTLIRALTTAGALCGLLGLSTMAAHAQKDRTQTDPLQRDYPHYRHALTDLRLARTYLWTGDDKNMSGDERQAVRSIDDAIEQCRSASILSDRDDVDRPSINVRLAHRDRLQKAATLLDDARRDLVIDEDHRARLEWRSKALTDVNIAFQSTQRAISPDYRDGRGASDHPHYRQALTDLRMARAYLRGDRDNDTNLSADQKDAMDRINHAIGEIRRASIDDGRSSDYLPDIDTRLDRRGRLQKATDLIASAKRSLGYSEDDRGSLGWRKNAQNDLADALNSTRRAIRDRRSDNRRDDRGNRN